MDPAINSLLSVSSCDSAIAQYEAHIIQIKKRRNSLLPISRLHRELFHHILQLALSQKWGGFTNQDSPIPFYSYYATLFVFRRVSHGWEHEIVNTPRFWTLISPLRSTSFQNLIWERSGAAAVEVDVSARGHSAFWSKAEKALLARIMTREIRQLRVLVPHRENVDAYLVDHHHPRMKVLSLRGGRSQIICTQLRIPQLEELYISRSQIIWDHLQLQNLRVLSVFETDGPNLAQLLSILQTSSRLERLSLSGVTAAFDGAGAPLNPIYLPQLSTINVSSMSLELTSGLLERLITSAACRLSSINWSQSQWSSSLGFFHQIGRICTPQGPEEQIIDPRLSLSDGYWCFETAPGRYLHTPNLDYQKPIMGLAEAARMFFETSKGLPLTAQSSRFRLELECVSHLVEALEIVHENFPETVELDVRCEEGLKGLAAALAEPKVEEGNPVWLLPELEELTLDARRDTFDYGRIIAMAIKRTQAATSSPSALSPITVLTLGQGRVRSKLLGRLKKAGIDYERDGVTVVA